MAARLLMLALMAFAVCQSVYSEKQHPKHRAVKSHPLANEAERETQFWMDKAQNILADKLKTADKPIVNKAKNIIMFLGDGMSIHTMVAARNLMGDSSKQVSFEKFPHFGLSKTYCVDRQVADSACTATAYLGGVKGNYGTIGVNAQVPRYDCTAGLNTANHVPSLAKWAQEAGKSSGLVTTARVTHASPAGVYAHTPNRNWENDYEVKLNNCSAFDNVDIARQLVEWPVGKNLNVIMGGGRRNFLDQWKNDEEGFPGMRTDGRNLIQDWLKEKQSRNLSAAYAWSRTGMRLIDLQKTDYILGLFSSSHCPYHGDLKRGYLTGADPSLTEMTETAIKVLQKNEKGFFLFVEGARIDMAHHDTKPIKSLEDTVEFANAIQKARDMTSEEDTLIVVTSDHSHTMTINGYPYRDQHIAGIAPELADDGKPYTILSYANGPGYRNTFSKEQGRNKLTEKLTTNVNFEFTSSVPLDSETHGGDDVGVFASGPWAHFFSGNYEQTNIPAMMARAAGIGPFANIQ